MRWTLLFACCCLPWLSWGQLPVSEVHATLPADLSVSHLLVPAFDLLDPELETDPQQQALVHRINARAHEANETLRKVVEKHYPHVFRLVPLDQVPALKDSGYRYFLDVALMPKQMKSPKLETLIPAYERYPSASHLFTNRNVMFHYYFYLRDLRSEEAYLTSRFRGYSEVYHSMKRFFQQVEKEGG